MTSLKKIRTPQPKFFSSAECRLEGLPRLLSLWTALYHFRRPSYERAKPRALARKSPQTAVIVCSQIRLFWHENPWILPLPGVKVLAQIIKSWTNNHRCLRHKNAYVKDESNLFWNKIRIFTSNESYARLIWAEMNQQQVNQFKLEIFVSFPFFCLCMHIPSFCLLSLSLLMCLLLA